VTTSAAEGTKLLALAAPKDSPEIVFSDPA